MGVARGLRNWRTHVDRTLGEEPAAETPDAPADKRRESRKAFLKRAFARQAMGLGPGVTGLLAGQGLHRSV